MNRRCLPAWLEFPCSRVGLGFRRPDSLLRFEMLDICLGCHIGLAAGGQSAHALPVLASARSITPQPPQVAALEQRRDRIRRQCESLFRHRRAPDRGGRGRDLPRRGRSARRCGAGPPSILDRDRRRPCRGTPTAAAAAARSINRSRSFGGAPRLRPRRHRPAPDRPRAPKPAPPGRAPRPAIRAALSSWIAPVRSRRVAASLYCLSPISATAAQ